MKYQLTFKIHSIIVVKLAGFFTWGITTTGKKNRNNRKVLEIFQTSLYETMIINF